MSAPPRKRRAPPRTVADLAERMFSEALRAAVHLFDDCSLPGDDDAYVYCRDRQPDARAALEDAWKRLGHLAPENPAHFVQEFRLHFHSRAWELFLISVLDGAGLALERPPPHGPDICVRLPSGLRCWIEAIAPTPGTGPDAVFQRPLDRSWAGSPGTSSKLLFRYSQALRAKQEAFEKYRSEGIVSPQDAVLIAIYQGAIHHSDIYDVYVPALAHAVLPIGEPSWRFEVLSSEPREVRGSEPHEVSVSRRARIRKASGQDVLTTFFFEPATAFVSGVLFASEPVWNLAWKADASLGLIHRPSATVPVPLGAIPTRCELWVENESLLHRGRCAQFGPYSTEGG